MVELPLDISTIHIERLRRENLHENLLFRLDVASCIIPVTNRLDRIDGG